jgi:hypothetical protein
VTAPWGTIFLPGQFPSSDWIAWLDEGEYNIYATEEAASAARDQPPVPSVPPNPLNGN